MKFGCCVAPLADFNGGEHPQGAAGSSASSRTAHRGSASLVDKTLLFKMAYRPFDKEIILLRSSRSRGKTPYKITSADGKIAVGKNERGG